MKFRISAIHHECGSIVELNNELPESVKDYENISVDLICPHCERKVSFDVLNLLKENSIFWSKNIKKSVLE